MNELRDKINQWGSLEGTFFNEDFTLSDILEQISYLESNSSNNIISQSFTDLNDLLDREFQNTIEKGRNYDIAQTYENVIVQKTDKDGYILTNIDLNGLLDEIGVESVTRGKDVLNKKENGWDIKSYKENDRFVITFGDNSTMTIRIGSRGRLILSEPSRDTLEKNTGIKLLSAKGTPRNFNYALKEIIDVNGEEKLVPISTNFISMDNQAVQDLKKGDILFMEVDLEDPHNKKILNEYKKDKNVKKLQNSLVISLKTNKNKLVGILKGVETDVVVGKNTNLEKLVSIRDTATKRVLDNLTEGSTVVDVGIRVPVENSYLGFPNLNITKKGVQNLPFTKESIKKVKDIGYILNNKIYLKNGNSTFESYPFLTNILKDGDAKYFNKKIPIVVFDFNGKNIGYPLVLNENLVDLSEDFNSIINGNLRVNDKIIEINKLLNRANIDVKKFGITFDNYNETKLQEVQTILSNVNEVGDISRWLDSNINMEDILMNDVSINIDITDRPFHSPKIRLNLKDDNVKGLDSEALVEFDTTYIEEKQEISQDKKDRHNKLNKDLQSILKEKEELNNKQQSLNKVDFINEDNKEVENFAKENNDGILKSFKSDLLNDTVTVYETSQPNDWSGKGSSFRKTWNVLKFNQGQYYAHVRILMTDKQKLDYVAGGKDTFSTALRNLAKGVRDKETVRLIDIRPSIKPISNESEIKKIGQRLNVLEQLENYTKEEINKLDINLGTITDDLLSEEC